MPMGRQSEKASDQPLAGKYPDRGDRPHKDAAALARRSDPRPGTPLPEPMRKIIGDLPNTECTPSTAGPDE